MANGRGGFLESMPVVTKNLIIINVLMWIATWVLKSKGIDLDQYLGLHYWLAGDFGIWQFVTYMFMHDTSSLQTGILHIFCNMFNLYMFGALFERLVGTKRFLLYYMVCGIGAGIVQVVVWHFTTIVPMINDLVTNAKLTYDQASTELFAGNVHDMMGRVIDLNQLITVGASGAVFGLLLAFGMSFPNLRMYIIPFPFPIKAKWMVIGYGAFELICGTQGLMNGVAHFAHLGGMLFGIGLILYWKHKGIIGGGGSYGYMG